MCSAPRWSGRPERPADPAPSRRGCAAIVAAPRTKATRFPCCRTAPVFAFAPRVRSRQGSGRRPVRAVQRRPPGSDRLSEKPGATNKWRLPTRPSRSCIDRPGAMSCAVGLYSLQNAVVSLTGSCRFNAIYPHLVKIVMKEKDKQLFYMAFLSRSNSAPASRRSITRDPGQRSRNARSRAFRIGFMR